MHLVQAALLILYGILLWYEVRIGLEEYAAFKLATETSVRQGFYRKWLVRGFATFFGSAIAGLAIVGHLSAVVSIPSEFSTLARRLNASVAIIHFDASFLTAFGISVGVIFALSIVVAAKRSGRAKPLFIGDIAPLMPRNWPETGYTFLLSLNAGLGEELFFRLFLPLLITLLCGSAPTAFIASAVIFGIMHVYQGWIGIVLTAFIGAVFTFIYLASGSIWLVIAVHAGFDLIGLVIRPTILRLIEAKRTHALSNAG